MEQNRLEQYILKLLPLNQPIKAIQLATMIGNDTGQHIDVIDVREVLYRFKKENKANYDYSYRWSMTNATASLHSPPPPPSQPVITFTKEQQAIIDLDPDKHLLIRGQAGSGKTTVLAARAGKILSMMNKGTLLFLTYNAALSSYVKEAFQKAGMKGDIDIKTFHDWSKSTAKAMGYGFSGWVIPKEREEQLKKIINIVRNENGNHRLYDISDKHLLAWWGEEIAWIFGQHITRLNEYLTVGRIGRGKSVRVSQDDRRIIWPVYERYTEWLEQNKKQDYDNPAGLLLQVLMEKGTDLPDEYRYDHVMIDEVQDFDKSWLLIAAKIPRVSLSMAGDLAQKIYRRNFTWVSVGLKIQKGRSRYLSGSYRTTRQIMEVAKFLLDENDVTDSPDYTPPELPKKNADKVKILIGSNPTQSYKAGYDYVANRFKRLNKNTFVAVVLPFSNQLTPCEKSLEERGLSVDKAKGTKLGRFDGGLVITTYHQLKGLEFDHVVIMGLHDAQYPGRILKNVEAEDMIQESSILRRILYMAMTRAKQSVTLVGASPFCRFFDKVPKELFEIIT